MSWNKVFENAVKGEGSMRYVKRAWELRFTRSITGWVLHSARRPHKAWLPPSGLPIQVLEYACSDSRGIIRDDEARDAIEREATPYKLEHRHSAEIVFPVKAKDPPTLDWDSAEYVGDGRDGVYIGAVRSGSRWWSLATVDSESGSFTETLAAEYGYRSRRAAITAARDAALMWCGINGVEHE
jgi:hypothetical protein